MAISSWRLELSRVTASLLRLPPPLWGRSVRTIRNRQLPISAFALAKSETSDLACARTGRGHRHSGERRPAQ